jgi:hypothetical protein
MGTEPTEASAPTEFTVASARQASDQNRLADWVTAFLSSRGSDNEALAAKFALEGATFLGPVDVELDRLQPLAGPVGDDVVVPVEREEWEQDVGDLEEKVDDGWEPPPVLVSARGGDLFVEDGNHRVESLRRVGETVVAAILVFDDDAERAAFLDGLRAV